MQSDTPSNPTLFSPARWLTIGTLFVAIAEWLMFELLRTPYEPPHDMMTFLGQEKYSLVAPMALFLIGWLVVVAVTLLRAKLTLKHHLFFIVLVALILAFFFYILENPRRPVTPWHFIWS